MIPDVLLTASLRLRDKDVEHAISTGVVGNPIPNPPGGIAPERKSYRQYAPLPSTAIT